MEPPIKLITADNINRGILRRLNNNDSKFTSMTVTGCRDPAFGDGTGYYEVYGADEGGLGWLGYFISKNVQLNSLVIRPEGHVSCSPSNEETDLFFEGVNCNKSITEMEFSSLGLFGGTYFSKLMPFFKNNHNLKSLYVDNCELGREGGRSLSLALSVCTSSVLKYFKIDDCEIDDETSAEIIIALGEHPELARVAICNNNMGRRGCLAMASLLQNPASKLEWLDLSSNSIDDEGVESLVDALTGKEGRELGLGLSFNESISTKGLRALSALLENSNLSSLDIFSINIGDEMAITFANALANNHTLTSLIIYDPTITAKGWSAFSELLCDTSSINKTYLSNHKICCLGYNERSMPSDILSRMVQNRYHISERQVAMNKILMHHNEFDMEPFFEWGFKALPFVIDWFEKAKTCPRNFEVANLDGKKLSSIYQFIRGMPALYIDSCLNHKEVEGRATKRLKQS